MTNNVEPNSEKKLFKLIGEASLTWVKVLPLALSMRGRSHTVTGLSPHEVLTGHPMRMTNTPFLKNRVSLQGMEEDMVENCVTLNSVLNFFDIGGALLIFG